MANASSLFGKYPFCFFLEHNFLSERGISSPPGAHHLYRHSFHLVLFPAGGGNCTVHEGGSAFTCLAAAVLNSSKRSDLLFEHKGSCFCVREKAKKCICELRASFPLCAVLLSPLWISRWKLKHPVNSICWCVVLSIAAVCHAALLLPL